MGREMSNFFSKGEYEINEVQVGLDGLYMTAFWTLGPEL